jgi:hypothetical protein
VAGVETLGTVSRKCPIVAVAIVVACVVAGCAGYGGEQVTSPEGKAIKSDAEHCQITLPEGWKWLPAAWAAESPLGTQMAFQEATYGRPEHPNWDEAIDLEEQEAVARGATVNQQPDRVVIDFGQNGGMSVIQRFDRIGCQLTFSTKQGVRAKEQPVWNQIVASLTRITPTD